MKETDRTERLLTVLVLQTMKGTTQREKALQLSLAGFSAVEIADLLDTSAQSINQALYESRKKKRGRAATKSRAGRGVSGRR
jgi:DNA-directed RNA polymerase specialized sigma24 family protein